VPRLQGDASREAEYLPSTGAKVNGYHPSACDRTDRHESGRADGRELPFADGEFDRGFSNAVVEHVAGGRDGQRLFVHELCRVARRVFVTTPNRWFPLEVHTLLPFVHWLPPGPRERLLPFDDVLDPLGPRDFAALFPYSVRVLHRGMALIAVGPE